MIIQPIYTSESLNVPKIDDFDKEILEYLVSSYGSDLVVQSLNEGHREKYGYDQTGGYKTSGLSGFAKSIPSFLLTSFISWPIALLTGVAALYNRFSRNFEDKNSWMNTLSPGYWTDYLGHSRVSSSSSSSSKSSLFGSSKDKSETSWVDRVKQALLGAGGAAGAAAGAALLAKDSSLDAADSSTELDKDEAKSMLMNAVFVPYWVTLSNGEIIRVRADSEEHAKMMANLIIERTEKPCYDTMNARIEKGMPKYTFYFSDGEKCYWSAPTQKQAQKEALLTRKSLCDEMNKVMPGNVQIDDLDTPFLDGKVGVERGKKIELPEKDRFLAVTTNKPERRNTRVRHELPKPVYKYGSFEHYRVGFGNFTINLPAYDYDEVKDVISLFNSRYAVSIIREIYRNMDQKADLYKVTMKDGDKYVVTSRNANGASSIGLKLYNAKVEALKKGLSDAAREEYDSFLLEYGDVLNNVQSVKPLELEQGKEYKGRKRNEVIGVKVLKDEKAVKQKTFTI